MIIDLNKYKRLLVFGSSDTLGRGLPDCSDRIPVNGIVKPSVYSWPILLGNKLSINTENHATWGASNKEIMLSILSSDIQKDDFVIVCWTHVNRTCLFDVNKLIKIFPKTPTYEVHEAEYFYRLYDIKNLIHNTLLEISHANLFLLSKQCGVYNFYTDHNIDSLKNPYPVSAQISHLNLSDMTVDIAPDKMHMGLKSHENVANHIYELLNA